MDNKIFDYVVTEDLKRNMFDLCHSHKTTADMGFLYPVTTLECIPGDRVTIGAEALVRFAPLIAPVMHKFKFTIHYWFIPNRILWSNWKTFLVSQPGLVGAPAFPYLDIDVAEYNALLNRFGIPDPAESGGSPIRINAMPLAAYQCCYNEKYRDQNLISPVNYQLVNGDNTANTALYTLRKRAWGHDYFTSCLPFAQKGDPVSLPVANFINLPVLINNTGVTTDISATFQPGGVPGTVHTGSAPVVGFGADYMYVPTEQFIAEAVDINDLREAAALQRWLEKNARGGTRMNEFIKMHFNVNSSDARLQLPEYITGISQNVLISEVLNTTGTDDLPQGNMAGHGVTAIDDGNFGSFYCEEHGFIIGIMSIMPDTDYQQGIERFWLKYEDITQYFFPAFENLGEQPVYTSEIWAGIGDPPTMADKTVFGYLPAWSEYRYKSNMVTGDFQTSLSFWTAARIFSAEPVLNQAFIECDARKDIFAVNDPLVNSLYIHIYHKIFMSRLIPVYAVPTLE